MSAIYIHIPFCKRRCIYCDFFSTTHGEKVDAYVKALVGEMKLRRGYLCGEKVNSIYFGGGTPSQLGLEHIQTIFSSLYSIFDIAPDAEITFEANPDDVTTEYADMLSSTKVNRVSMGVQSFNDDTLRLLRRRHSAGQAREAVTSLVEAGFSNISIDLIYGLPGQSLDAFRNDLDEALSLPVTHLSAYSLSYEEGTELWRLREENRGIEAPDTLSLDMYRMLMNKTREAGFEHYEISNFCRPGLHSRHNSCYWDGSPYLGLGASAHSFDGKSRQWNVADLDVYIKGVYSGEPCFEIEHLSHVDLYNEFVQTRLRTSKGASLNQMKTEFGEQLLNYMLSQVKSHIDAGRAEIVDGHLRLTREGIFTSDDIISDLFSLD